MKQDPPAKPATEHESLRDRKWRQLQPSLRGELAGTSLETFAVQAAKAISEFGKGPRERER